MAINGTAVLILADIGGATFNIVGSQRDATMDETAGVIDISSKDQRERKVLSGRYESNISMEELYVPTDAAYLALLASMRNGTIVAIRRRESGTDKEEADAIVTSISRDFPDQGEATISIELAIDGAWTAV